MVKYIIAIAFVGISFIHADSIQNLEKLKAEKQALVLKLEAYTLKKKIIEMQNFIENDRIQKEKRRERERALIRFKNELRSSRNRVHRTHLVYAR